VACLRVVHSRWPRYANVLSWWVHPCLFIGLERFFTWWKPLQPYKAYARSSSSLQLESSCGVENSTTDSFLTGWWAAQITILSWIVPVCLGASPTRNCKRGSALFHWNCPKNPITTLVSIDDVLLEVRNRKERCRVWSLVATTSHVRTLACCYSKTRLARALPYLSKLQLYDWVMLVCLQLPIKCTPCFSLTIELCPCCFAKGFPLSIASS
jgi:hypothetical protein